MPKPPHILQNVQPKHSNIEDCSDSCDLQAGICKSLEEQNYSTYLVTIFTQVKGDKIQSENEKVTFLSLCFIQTHDCTCAIVKISSASTFA